MDGLDCLSTASQSTLDEIVSSLESHRQELSELSCRKALIESARRQNLIQQSSLGKTLLALKRTYVELKAVLDSLDAADEFDLQDQVLEIVALDRGAQQQATQSPISVETVRTIPLLRLQAIERAEYDHLLAGSPWSDMEDRQLTAGIKLAAVRSLAVRYQMDSQFTGDPLQAVAHLSDDRKLEFADLENENDTLDRIDWDFVASQVPTRNQDECRTRWIMVLRPGVNCKPWSADETKKLRNLVVARIKACKNVDWETVAKTLDTGRTGYSCFLQFCRTNPQSKAQFTPNEDNEITTLFHLFGGSWRLMALHLSTTRSKSDIYARFTRCLDPRIARGKWTREEDQTLRESIKELGEGDWALVSSRIRGRTSLQCRERWNRRLKGTWADENTQTRISKSKRWTKEDDEVLMQGLTDDLQPKPGLKWVDLPQLFSTWITDKQIRDRVNVLRSRRKRQEQQEPSLKATESPNTVNEGRIEGNGDDATANQVERLERIEQSESQEQGNRLKQVGEGKRSDSTLKHDPKGGGIEEREGDNHQQLAPDCNRKRQAKSDTASAQTTKKTKI